MSEVVTDLRTVVEPERLGAAMRRAVDAAGRRRPQLPAPQVLVKAPGFEFVSGERSRRFHAASVGKTMTATRAFQLAATGRLDLDAPLTALLPADDWRGLFVRDGHDHAARVTPRHLIEHTSGVADYFSGRTSGSPSFARLLDAEPDRLWTPRDLLAFTRDHQRPVAEPGRRFSYSDTGYVLLGRVIEVTGGAPLGAQLHGTGGEGVFAPAGMADSCLLFHTLPGGEPSTDPDPGVALDIAPIRLGSLDLAHRRALSCDWGGGGVVTTLDDLVRFTTAWTDGGLLSSADRAVMTDARHRFRPGIRYGAGAMQLRYQGFSPFLRGLPRPVGHLGVTAVHAFTAPELGIHLAINMHSTREMVRSFRLHIRLMQLLVRALRG
ncbi:MULTISPECIES: serine hydrolase domain-containing protein [Microbacterium]|uniref:serine hydrolase domain-containing protein n=1 Tax=Microbacterium TaxID=33882 RepID=UPI0013A5A35A|nr:MULTISPECIES: serine hydrolase domain-containing protein [Microbacterium]